MSINRYQPASRQASEQHQGDADNARRKSVITALKRTRDDVEEDDKNNREKMLKNNGVVKEEGRTDSDNNVEMEDSKDMCKVEGTDFQSNQSFSSFRENPSSYTMTHHGRVQANGW